MRGREREKKEKDRKNKMDNFCFIHVRKLILASFPFQKTSRDGALYRKYNDCLLLHGAEIIYKNGGGGGSSGDGGKLARNNVTILLVVSFPLSQLISSHTHTLE